MTNGRRPDTLDRVASYFRAKRNELLAKVDSSVCEHTGLIGGHRESFLRIYLSNILPSRFQIGRGMVYGPSHRSREADVVIWDYLNYPSLPAEDHAFFFAESVRAVLEVKSSYSEDEFENVLVKSKAVRNIIAPSGLSLEDRLAMIELNTQSAISRAVHDGLVITPHHIGTGAVFLRGGHTFSAQSISGEVRDRADDRWPDVIVFLEPGKVAVKSIEEGRGNVQFYELGEDALFGFTAVLLQLLAERSTQTERDFYLWRYAPSEFMSEVSSYFEFSLTRPAPGRSPLWRTR